MNPWLITFGLLFSCVWLLNRQRRCGGLITSKRPNNENVLEEDGTGLFTPQWGNCSLMLDYSNLTVSFCFWIWSLIDNIEEKLNDRNYCSPSSQLEPSHLLLMVFLTKWAKSQHNSSSSSSSHLFIPPSSSSPSSSSNKICYLSSQRHDRLLIISARHAAPFLI